MPMLKIGSERRKYLGFVALALLPALLIALFVLGAQPFAVNLIPVPYDKFAHLLLFAVLAALFGAAAGLLPLGRASVLVFAVCGALAVGVADELHQTLLPGRSGGWDDLTFDVLGALGGAWLLRRLGLVR